MHATNHSRPATSGVTPPPGMPHFTNTPGVASLNDDEIINAFALETKLRRLSLQRPSSRGYEQGRLEGDDGSASAAAAAAPVRPVGWMNEVVSRPSRRQTQIDPRRFSAASSAQQDRVGSPSHLRATAPSFAMYLARDNQNAIIDEEEEERANVQASSNARRSQQTPDLVTTGIGIRSRTSGSSPSVNSAVGPGEFRGFRRGDSPQLPVVPVKRLPLSPTNELPGFQLPLPLPPPVNDRNLVPKMRANTLPAHVNTALEAAGQWRPTGSFADFADGSGRNGLNRENSMFAVVEFKMFRAEVYQMSQGWAVDLGVSLVIVEADRGYDLGKVSHLTYDIEEARTVKKDLYRRHWKALIKSSTEKDCDPKLSEDCFEYHYNHIASSAHASGFTASLPPKSVVGKATMDHMTQLHIKEGAEEKARRKCQEIANNLGLKMEILSAEFQLDWQKLTLFYLSPHYIRYDTISSEIFKQYKCRLWYTALNPASFHEKANQNRWHGPSSSPGAMLALPDSPAESSKAPHSYFASDGMHNNHSTYTKSPDEASYSSSPPMNIPISPWNGSGQMHSFGHRLTRNPWNN